jgi:hypothetical protein
MIVARQFCRNRNTTRNTSSIASPSVFSTSRIDTSTKRVVSYGTAYVSPSGKRVESSCAVVRTVFATSSALAPGVRKMPTSVAGLPL